MRSGLDSGENYEWTNSPVLAEYKRAVAVQLGPLNNVPVPPNLREQYEHLISPFETAFISRGVCRGPLLEQPLPPLPERSAISALVSSANIDLLANVLRGYNSGARVDALLALEHLRRNGAAIRADVTTTMRKVQELDVPVSTCFADIVNRGLRARDIVKHWRDYEPW